VTYNLRRWAPSVTARRHHGLVPPEHASDASQIPLKWQVFAAKRQGVIRELPPCKEQLNWVVGSATLIYGARDAVLVDTLLTIDQNRALADWLAAQGKNLSAIYITHGHGDHFFGLGASLALGALLHRFP
jgi:glyoxylase-like metal-dependent hydrolase (beta-lactamase superfamily II)